jgi:hypothetical protein
MYMYMCVCICVCVWFVLMSVCTSVGAKFVCDSSGRVSSLTVFICHPNMWRVILHRHNATLRSLHLCGRQIGDVGAAAIGEGLRCAHDCYSGRLIICVGLCSRPFALLHASKIEVGAPSFDFCGVHFRNHLDPVVVVAGLFYCAIDCFPIVI